MAEIHTFSLCYDPQEDRIAWDMADADGATTRLWLTQKFCRGLVGALAPLLTRRAAADLMPPQEAALQSWEQAAAMADFGKIPSVRPSDDTTSGLVQTAHITPKPGGMSLVFEFAPDQSRNLGLDHAALRKALAMMHRLHGEAGWPMDFWPAWVAQPAVLAAGADLN